MKLGGDGAVRLVLAVALHQEIRGGPIRVAVEQRTDDAAVEHSRKRLMMRFSVPLGDNLVPLREAVYMQPLLIRRSASEADALRRIELLQGSLFHKPSAVTIR